MDEVFLESWIWDHISDPPIKWPKLVLPPWRGARFKWYKNGQVGKIWEAHLQVVQNIGLFEVLVKFHGGRPALPHNATSNGKESTATCSTTWRLPPDRGIDAERRSISLCTGLWATRRSLLSKSSSTLFREGLPSCQAIVKAVTKPS